MFDRSHVRTHRLSVDRGRWRRNDANVIAAAMAELDRAKGRTESSGRRQRARGAQRVAHAAGLSSHGIQVRYGQHPDPISFEPDCFFFGRERQTADAKSTIADVRPFGFATYINKDVASHRAGREVKAWMPDKALSRRALITGR